MAADGSDRRTLPCTLHALYGFPMLLVGALIMLFEAYFMKFSTDTLYIAPS